MHQVSCTAPHVYNDVLSCDHTSKNGHAAMGIGPFKRIILSRLIVDAISDSVFKASTKAFVFKVKSA